MEDKMSVSQNRREIINYSRIFDFEGGVFGESMHAKRVLSLANSTLGSMRIESLASLLFGQGLAQTKDLEPKQCINQVDRLLSNWKLEVRDLLDEWVLYLVETCGRLKKSSWPWTGWNLTPMDTPP